MFFRMMIWAMGWVLNKIQVNAGFILRLVSNIIDIQLRYSLISIEVILKFSFSTCKYKYFWDSQSKKPFL